MWTARRADTIVVTGGSGPYSTAFKRPEAEVFADAMCSAGVPPEAIVMECRARNTGENVSYGIDAFAQSRGSIPETILAVSNPFLMRRCVATFKKQFPNIEILASPPRGEPLDFIDRPLADYAHRLLGELDRLSEYANKGFVARTVIPTAVLESSNAVRELLVSEG